MFNSNYNSILHRFKVSEWVSSALRPHQHSIGYTGDGFYRSKDTCTATFEPRLGVIQLQIRWHLQKHHALNIAY